eukprot:3684925-Amphidinium_carterae.1
MQCRECKRFRSWRDRDSFAWTECTPLKEGALDSEPRAVLVEQRVQHDLAECEVDGVRGMKCLVCQRFRRWTARGSFTVAPCTPILKSGPKTMSESARLESAGSQLPAGFEAQLGKWNLKCLCSKCRVRCKWLDRHSFCEQHVC